MKKYLNELTSKFKDDNIWFSNPNNCFYLTKFSNCTNMNVFLINKKWYFITDDRYIQRAEKELKNDFIIFNSNEKPFSEIINEVKKTKKMEIIVDGDDLSINKFNFIKNKFKDITFIPQNFDNLRVIKSDEEILNIKKACKITDEIFTNLLKDIKPGVTELDVKRRLEILIIQSDAQGLSFEPIIAGGINSSNPHWTASNYVLKKEDIVTIDFGIKYNGMCSDMTRTIAVNQKENSLSSEQEKVHKIVLETLKLAIENIKIGTKLSELESITRDYLKKFGYDKYFIHSLGHGLGIEVHEQPYFSLSSNTALLENMIITIEPGVYLPNKFGCRIENDILVTKKGFEVLNMSSLNLFVKI